MVVVRRNSGAASSVTGVLVFRAEDLPYDILVRRVLKVVVDQSSFKVRISAVGRGLRRGFDDLQW